MQEENARELKSEMTDLKQGQYQTNKAKSNKHRHKIMNF